MQGPIDIVGPKVTSAEISGVDNTYSIKTGTLVAGDKVKVVLTMSEATTVTGTPTFAIDVGGVTKTASYASGSGTSALTFYYTVASGDTDSIGGITASANALALAGGSLKDAAGNDVTLATSAISAGSNSAMIDAVTTASSTNPTIAWTRLLGTNSDDRAYALTTSADGSIYMAGSSQGNFYGTVSNGGMDAFLTKFKSDHSIEWSLLLGTSQLDLAQGVVLGPDGAIYVTGSTEGALDNQAYSPNGDTFVAKFNPDGTTVWVRLLGSGMSENGTGVALGRDGAIYISGTTQGNLDNQIINGLQDAFIAKYLPDGSRAWTRLVGSISFDGSMQLCVEGLAFRSRLWGRTGWPAGA